MKRVMSRLGAVALVLALMAGCGKEKGEKSPVMPGVPEAKLIRTSGVWTGSEWYIDEDHSLVVAGAKTAPAGVAGIGVDEDSTLVLNTAVSNNINSFIIDVPSLWNEDARLKTNATVQKIRASGAGFFIALHTVPVGGVGFPFWAKTSVELRMLRGEAEKIVTVETAGSNFPLSGAAYADQSQAFIFDFATDTMTDVSDKIALVANAERLDLAAFDVSQALIDAPEDGYLVVMARFQAKTMYGLPSPLNDPTFVSTFRDFIDEVAATVSVDALRGVILLPEYQPVEIGFSDLAYPDYTDNEAAIAAYRQWLIEGFGDVVRFNKEVGRDYKTFTEVGWEVSREPNLAAEALSHNTFGIYEDAGQRHSLDKLQRDFHQYFHSMNYSELAKAAQRVFNRVPVLASLRIQFPQGSLPVIARYLLNQGIDGIATRMEIDLADIKRWDPSSVLQMLSDVQEGAKRTKAWIMADVTWKGKLPQQGQLGDFFNALVDSGAKGFFIGGLGLNTPEALTRLGSETEQLGNRAIAVRPADILARKKPAGDQAKPASSSAAAQAQEQLKPDTSRQQGAQQPGQARPANAQSQSSTPTRGQQQQGQPASGGVSQPESSLNEPITGDSTPIENTTDAEQTIPDETEAPIAAPVTPDQVEPTGIAPVIELPQTIEPADETIEPQAPAPPTEPEEPEQALAPEPAATVPTPETPVTVSPAPAAESTPAITDEATPAVAEEAAPATDDGVF